MTSVCVAVLQTYVAIPLAGGTFEHELLNLGRCGPDYRFWASLIWCMRCLHENVVVCTTLNRCELVPSSETVFLL